MTLAVTAALATQDHSLTNRCISREELSPKPEVVAMSYHKFFVEAGEKQRRILHKAIGILMMLFSFLLPLTQSAFADVTFTFQEVNGGLKVTYSGSVTGVPSTAGGAGAFGFLSRSVLIKSSASQVLFGLPLSCGNSCQPLFTGAQSFSASSSSGDDLVLAIGAGAFNFTTNQSAQSVTVSGEMVFNNKQLSDLGTVADIDYALVGSADKVLIRFVQTPTVTSVSPSAGPVAGGTQVTITGTNFTGATSVSFGGAPATNVTVVNDTTITATTPAAPLAGNYSVAVTSSGVTGTGANAYRYAAIPTVAEASPGVGPLAGGASITIAGNAFTGATAVTIGGVAATNVTVLSDSRISLTTPAGTVGPADVVVTTPGGTGTGTGAYVYAVAPTVTSVSPNSGLPAGGTSVTISGTDFTGATAVTFGGTAAATFQVLNATTIAALTPPGALGAADVVVTTPAGTGTGTGVYTYAAGPTVALTTSAVSPVNRAFAMTATFSSAVTGFTAHGITVGYGTVSNLQGSGAVYTFDVTPTQDGTVTVDIPANVAVDGNNQGNSAAPQFSIAADVTAPTVSLTTTATSPVTGLFSVTATFSEPVTGLSLGGVAVTGGTASNLQGSGTTYSFDVTPSVDGTVTAQVNAGAAQDAAQNPNSASNQLSMTADITSPTVALTTPSTTTNGPFTVTATFSEEVTGFVLGSVNVSGGTTTNLAGSGNTYTFTVTPTTSGTVTVDVAANAAQDSAQRGNLASNELTVSVDLVGPSVTLTSTSARVTGSFIVTATFSENVTGFSAASLNVSNGTASNVSGSGAIYTFEVSPAADGEVTVQALQGAAQDGAGNPSSPSNTLTIAADLTAPTVALTGPTGQVTGPFTLTMTFSEPVTGFTSSGLSVAQATVSDFTEVTPGTVYTALLSPVMGQTVTATVQANAAQDGAGNGNEASDQYSVQAGSVKSAFNEYKDEIKRIIQDQAERRLITLMNDNGRMMQDARSRFVGFVSGPDGQQMGLMQNGFDAIAFDVDGTVDVSGDLNGIVAASSGEFLGQTGMVNGANWRLSGNFDVLLDGDQSLVSVDARMAREQFLTRNVLWGAFGGGQYSSSDIEDSFVGSETTWQLYVGTYAVGKLTSNLFADGYASIGYGWSDLSMNNDVLLLDSNYGTLTWQVGGSLAGLIEMERFSLLPTVSVAYGNSNLGEIDFTAQAYGLSDGVSLDADYVAMGVLRLTPEVRIPLGTDATTEDGVVLGLLPSFICEQVVADDSETHCGWGVGAEIVQVGTSGFGQFSGQIDFEQVGGISRIGGQIGYSIQF